MHIESIRSYCLSKKAVTESMPFDDKTLVFKVAGKIFALINLNSDPLRLNLKCNPEKAIDLRERFESVLPGYHSNKKHWNTIEVTGEISKGLLNHFIDHSYDLVKAKLTKKVRQDNLL